MGFSASSGSPAFENDVSPTSVYTAALVHNIKKWGYELDVVALLERVRQDVCDKVRGSRVEQAPCVYSAKGEDVMLVLVLGSVRLAPPPCNVTLFDIVLPLVEGFKAQVSACVLCRPH